MNQQAGVKDDPGETPDTNTSFTWHFPNAQQALIYADGAGGVYDLTSVNFPTLNLGPIDRAVLIARLRATADLIEKETP